MTGSCQNLCICKTYDEMLSSVRGFYIIFPVVVLSSGIVHLSWSARAELVGGTRTPGNEVKAG